MTTSNGKSAIESTEQSLPVYAVGACRLERQAPNDYRLAKKQDGTLVLQGAYLWEEGRAYGHTWKDIPTMNYEEMK